MNAVDALRQVVSKMPEAGRRHEVFHRTCFSSLLDVVEQFYEMRKDIFEDGSKEANGEYASMCVSLAKVAAMMVGLSVGINDNSNQSEREVRLMLSMILVFVGEMQGKIIIPDQKEVEFARVICRSLEPEEVPH